MGSYDDFLEKKRITTPSDGFEPKDVNPMLYPFQRDIVKWACRKGKACIFADCGMGKTPMQLEWAHQVVLARGGGRSYRGPACGIRADRARGPKVRHLGQPCKERG